MVIDFQGLLKSGMLVFLSRGKKKIGYDNAREMSSIFLNKKIPQYPMDCHAVDRNINLVKHLGVKPEKVTFTMFIGEEDKRRAEHHLSDNKINKNKRLVAINSQAGWATKIWSPLKLAKLSDMIIKDFDAQIIFTGGKDDNPSVENILFSMDHRAVNLAGKTTLKELAHILSISDLMITMDSGPMHIASAMGTPTVPLFGPTAPWRTGPYCNNAIIIRNQIPCSPCFKRKCDTMDCMNKISIDDVLGAVQKQFGRMRKQ
jgi:3-deoxy-D-manno-octulosonic-acid transferase/heptosyltransferase-1